jgi:pimeloyl-ACP methyl ester carboxylesterase
VLQATGAGAVVVLGESMGAYVGVVLAAEHPTLVRRLVLADGGLPLPLPQGLADNVDPAVITDMVLGPAITRLSMIFESQSGYLDFWRQHPAFQRDWSDDIEAYLEYDLEPCEGGFRSRVNETAVRVDGAQHIAEPRLISEALARVACPITLVRAPRNLLNQPVPLLSDAVASEWQSRLPTLSVEMAEDLNHYTLMMGARGAGILAARVARAS